jgi:hypothetical protein
METIPHNKRYLNIPLDHLKQEKVVRISLYFGKFTSMSKIKVILIFKYTYKNQNS